MPRPRLIYGLDRAGDELRRPPEAPMPVEPGAEPGLAPVPASSAKLSPVNRVDVLRWVQMENIHPLRLRLLLEIERTGSISAAAEACGIGQPSASVHLRTLESAIGQTLVTRTGRGSSLTSAGSIVASYAARVLATLESMRGALDAVDTHAGGELTIAASLTPSVAVLPAVLRQFSDVYPGVRVSVRTIPSQLVIQEVTRASAAIGIAGEVGAREPVARRQIMVDELIGIAPVGLIRTEQGFVTGRELARHSVLLGGEGSSTRLVAERHLARADCRPTQIWAFDSYEAIKRAVTGGLGVSFVSQLLVREEIARGELAPFRLAGIGPMLRPIDVVHSTVAALTPHAAAFMTLLMDSSTAAHPVDRVAHAH